MSKSNKNRKLSNNGPPKPVRWKQFAKLIVVLGLIVVAEVGGREWSLHQCERTIALRDYPTATTWLTRANWLGPSTARSLFLQARLDRKQGRLEQFAASIARAEKGGVSKIKIQLENLLAISQTGRMSEIESRMGTLLIDQNHDAAEICEAFVLGCLLNYRFADAQKILDLWQADYPDDPQPHYLRGRILEHENNYEGSEKEFRLALKLQPRHAAAAYNLGRLLTLQQMPAEARDIYLACARMLTLPNAAWVGIGRSERALGHSEEARRWLLKGVDGSERPEVQEVYRWMGETAESARAQAAQELGQLELDQQNFAEAVRWFEKAVKANPHDWKVRHGFATALRNNGELERAKETFAIVEEYRSAWQRIDKLFDQLQQHPTSAEVRTQIGAAFLKYYSENQGLIWLNSALSYDPNFSEAHELLADYFAAHMKENAQFEDLAKRHRRKVSPTPANHQPHLDSPP